MEKSKGLGDTVEKITTITGIKPLLKSLVEQVLKLNNKDCGCDERKEKLNKVFPHKK